MNYYKHSELANQYHVSLKTVHNWIGAAKENKLGLTLYEAKSGTYVANTAENTHILETLAEKGKKYRNTLHHRIIHPREEFYKVYTQRQILDIINNLSINHEIPGQYNYLENGANNWDNWIQRLATDNTTNYLKGTVELIHNNLAAIDRQIEGYDRVNVVDLGAGNAFPVRELLAHLSEKGILHRYIATDISSGMLSLARANVMKWFGDKVKFEGYVRDMTHEKFDDLLVDDMLDDKAEKTINMVLLFGGTAANFQSFSDPIGVARRSMNRNDIFLYMEKLDTDAARRYFDFTVKNGNDTPQSSSVSEMDKYILDLMGFDESIYAAETGFDEQKHMRYIRIRMLTAVTIEYRMNQGVQHVSFEKGETILILRILHHTSLEIISEFERNGFALLHSSLWHNRQYYFSISAVEAKNLKT